MSDSTEHLESKIEVNYSSELPNQNDDIPDSVELKTADSENGESSNFKTNIGVEDASDGENELSIVLEVDEPVSISIDVDPKPKKVLLLNVMDCLYFYDEKSTCQKHAKNV